MVILEPVVSELNVHSLVVMVIRKYQDCVIYHLHRTTDTLVAKQ